MVKALYLRQMKILVVLLFLSCHFLSVHSQFQHGKSCSSSATDVLQVSPTKMWMKTSDVEAHVTGGQHRVYLQPNSLFMVRKKNGTRTFLSGPIPGPGTININLGDINELRFDSGFVAVSCRRGQKNAEIELAQIQKPGHSSSTVPPLTAELSATTESPRLGPGILRSIDLTTFNNTTTTERESSQEQTTQEPETLSKPTPPKDDTGKASVAITPVLNNTTTTSTEKVTTTPALEETSDETTTNEATQEGNLSDTTKAILTTISTTTTPSRTNDNQSTTQMASTTTELGPYLSAAPGQEPSDKPWKLKDHIAYIAGGAVALFVTLLVIMIICIVQRKKKAQGRRLPDGNEDFFISTTYDEALLRHPEGGNSNNVRIRMYSEVEPEILVPHELEERVLGSPAGNGMEPEKPRCLGNGSGAGE